jgi:hypothetical protein
MYRLKGGAKYTHWKIFPKARGGCALRVWVGRRIRERNSNYNILYHYHLVSSFLDGRIIISVTFFFFLFFLFFLSLSLFFTFDVFNINRRTYNSYQFLAFSSCLHITRSRATTELQSEVHAYSRPK